MSNLFAWYLFIDIYCLFLIVVFVIVVVLKCFNLDQIGIFWPLFLFSLCIKTCGEMFVYSKCYLEACVFRAGEMA